MGEEKDDVKKTVTSTCGAVEIIKADTGGHKFLLDETTLGNLLMKEEVREKNVVVISVAGAFRKGKSFLLDFFIRYLEARYRKQDVNNWIGPDDVPLDGFKWKGGSERVTAGILMWSDIYLAETSNGQDVAIILLDTQGAFDSNSTVCDCATIFALSTMISSVQVYNISQNIQEDDLQHLQLFTEYGRLALADCGRIPFQKLLFLVRDWSFPYEAEYGITGGKILLEKRLKVNNGQHPELQFLRRHIKSCFSEISCFLMPHPGLMVATNPYFDGKVRDIEPDFTYCIELLAPLLLSPENLTIKKISGQMVKAKELFLYFKTYSKIFSCDELPEPKSMLVATAEANNLAALATAKEKYILAMEEYCGGLKPYLNSAILEKEHFKQKTLAVENFSSKRKMGGDEISEKYRLQLALDLDQMYKHYKLQNESKNIFKAAMTPSVFMASAVITYVLSGIFTIIGLYTFSGICNLLTTLSIITLMTWSYLRYTGDYAHLCVQLDFFAETLWDSIMKPLYKSLTTSNNKDGVVSGLNLSTEQNENNVPSVVQE